MITSSKAPGGHAGVRSTFRRLVGWYVLGMLILAACGPALAEGTKAKDDSFRLQLEAPITTWDEAIPLGNGLTGGLLWGEGNEIRLSLDRGDLWDERLPDIYQHDNWNYDTIRRLKAEGNQAEISRLFDAPYHQPYPTKLPGGRLVVTLAPNQRARSFSLDMRRAVGQVNLEHGAVEVFFSAQRPVAMIRVPGDSPAYEFQRPAGLDRLGYKPATFGKTEDTTWMVQDAALGLTYAVVVAAKRVGNETQLAVAITTNRDGDDPLAIGRQRVESALTAGYEGLLEGHVGWWTRFWSTSSVTVPDSRIQRHYNLVQYFYGAASRADAPPIPLQGVWTRDDGNLPPWKGDYHHDLNTQMTYLPYAAAGLFDSGLSFINAQWNLLPVYRRFARDFYHVDGAAMPGVATQAGKATGGWSQYSLSPTNALWVGQSFYLHWRYTMDREFLERRAYPWLREMATGIVNLLEERDGKLCLPLSSSPEIHNNSLRAWLQPNSNYDLELMQWAFQALYQMADELGKTEDRQHWRQLLSKLDAPLVDDQQVLMFSRGEPLAESHRHHSPTMAIHPLGTLNIEGSDRDRAVIRATLERMHKLGTQAWVGFSFSWAAALSARAGQPEAAWDYLDKFVRAFILRNGFHANGDQTRSGLSGFTYRPFTLEGNFLAMSAVHEMLLQSWAPNMLDDPDPIVRIFPATPRRWQNASFTNLRAEGGFIVSAERRNNVTVSFRVTATHRGLLRVRDNFAGSVPKFNRNDIRHEGKLYLVHLDAGETLEATFARDRLP